MLKAQNYSALHYNEIHWWVAHSKLSFCVIEIKDKCFEALTLRSNHLELDITQLLVMYESTIDTNTGQIQETETNQVKFRI